MLTKFFFGKSIYLLTATVG